MRRRIVTDAARRLLSTKRHDQSSSATEVIKDIRKLAEEQMKKKKQQHHHHHRHGGSGGGSGGEGGVSSSSSTRTEATTRLVMHNGNDAYSASSAKKVKKNASAFGRIENARKTLNEYWLSFGSSKNSGKGAGSGGSGRHHRHPTTEMKQRGGTEETSTSGGGGGGGGSSYFFNPYWQKTEQVIDYATIDAVARAYKKPPNPISSLRHAGVKFPNVLFHPATLRWYKEYWMCLYEKAFVEKPFLAALATSVFKCVSSDAFVQIFVEGNTHLDYQRVGCFFALGVAYVGAFQYSLYNHMLKPLYGVMKPKLGIPGATGAIVAADQLFVAPFVYFPTFLAIKMWSENKTSAGEFYGTLKTLWNDTVFETMRALWIVWVPAQMFNFWVVPRHLTIPFMNIVGFGWNGILSYVHGQRKILDAKEREEAKMFVERMSPLLSGSKEAHPVTIANARAMTTTSGGEGVKEQQEDGLIAGLMDSQVSTKPSPRESKPEEEDPRENEEPREQDVQQ